MIDDYHFGSLTIDGAIYSHDLILHGEKILNDNWWRAEGHNITISDLSDLPEIFDVLVIGNGADGVCNVPQDTIDFVTKKGAEVIIQKTGDAIKTYNQFLQKGKDVVGAFHLTC